MNTPQQELAQVFYADDLAEEEEVRQEIERLVAKGIDLTAAVDRNVSLADCAYTARYPKLGADIIIKFMFQALTSGKDLPDIGPVKAFNHFEGQSTADAACRIQQVHNEIVRRLLSPVTDEEQFVACALPGYHPLKKVFAELSPANQSFSLPTSHQINAAASASSRMQLYGMNPSGSQRPYKM